MPSSADRRGSRAAAVFVLLGIAAAPLGTISLVRPRRERHARSCWTPSGRWYPGTGTGAFGRRSFTSHTHPRRSSRPRRTSRSRWISTPTATSTSRRLRIGLLTVYSNMRRHAGRTTLFTPNTTVGSRCSARRERRGCSRSSNAGAGPTPYPAVRDPLPRSRDGRRVRERHDPAERARRSHGIPAGPWSPGLTIAWQALVGVESHERLRHRRLALVRMDRRRYRTGREVAGPKTGCSRITVASIRAKYAAPSRLKWPSIPK